MKEVDPHGFPADKPGAKLDAGKEPVFTHLLEYFPRALAEVARVSEFGARKYTRMGWAFVPDGIARYTDALVRHLLAMAAGRVWSDDTVIDGVLYPVRHRAQVAWNALASLELELLEEENERRKEVGRVIPAGGINGSTN